MASGARPRRRLPAGEADAVDAVDAQALHQQPHAGVERRLGELDRAHVVLRDAQRRAAVGARVQLVGPGAAVGADARIARRERAVDRAVVPDHAGEIQLRDDLDDPRAADAGDAGRGGRRREAGIVRPQLAADHLDARLERRGIDAHALDGARRRALAAADLRAFERGTGGARAGEEAVAVAEHDLRVGADVDQQRHLVRQIGPLGEHDAGGVGAHVAGDARQHVDARVAVNGEIDLGRPQRQRGVGRERERRAAQLDRADAEQQVVHDRIADERRLEDVLAARCPPAARRPRRGR